MKRNLYSCLTCGGVDTPHRETTSGRVFCNAVCQQSWHMVNLRIDEADEAGLPVNDDDVIGLQTKSGRRFRVTRAQAMQMETIKDLLEGAQRGVENDYIEVGIDAEHDIGLAILIDYFKESIDHTYFLNMNNHLLFKVMVVADYMSPTNFIWSILLPALKNVLVKSVKRLNIEYRTVGSSNYDGVLHEIAYFIDKVKRYIPLIIYICTADEISLFYNAGNTYDNNNIIRSLVKDEASFANTYKDGWNIVYSAKRDDLNIMKKLFEFHFDWALLPSQLNILFSEALSFAVITANINMVLYLLNDQRITPHIDFAKVFPNALKGGNLQIQSLLIERASAADKYLILSHHIRNISFDNAQSILRDVNSLDDSVFVSASASNRADILNFMMKKFQVSTAVMKLAFKEAAASGAHKTIAILLQDDRIDPSVIAERDKTPEIIVALRDRYRRDAAAQDAATQDRSKRFKK